MNSSPHLTYIYIQEESYVKWCKEELKLNINGDQFDQFDQFEQFEQFRAVTAAHFGRILSIDFWLLTGLAGLSGW